MKRRGVLSVAAGACLGAAAQTLPTPADPMVDAAITGLPRDLRSTESMADTTGKFLENIAFDKQGRLYAASLMERRILRWEEGKPLSTFADLGIYPMSLESDIDGTWYVVGHAVSFSKDLEEYQRSQQVWRLTSDGKAEHLVSFPDARAL